MIIINPMNYECYELGVCCTPVGISEKKILLIAKGVANEKETEIFEIATSVFIIDSHYLVYVVIWVIAGLFCMDMKYLNLCVKLLKLNLTMETKYQQTFIHQ
jgi:hypothetical protein